MKNTHSINCFSIHRKLAAGFVVILLMSTLMLPLLSVNVSAASSDQINYFGTTVPCGKDNGYIPNTTSKWNPLTLFTGGAIMGLIPDDDPHKGWSLGSFYVEGFSGMTTSDLNAYNEKMPVYLKNPGDTITFGFKLDQNIDKLNGDSSLTIADDHKIIQDCWIEEPYVKGDFHRGVLVVVHTDYQGKETLTTYRDFLKGKSVGANTEIQIMEPGEYRVILCYEIHAKKWGFMSWLKDFMDPNGSWFAYRMEAYFSVRTGNAMVYPFDLETGSELTNKTCTEAGFKVDLAKSRYIQLSVKKENLNFDGTDIIEDTRFNKVVADNTEFNDEGKYTITAKNPYTGLTSEKVIYVGDNDIMRCNTVTGMSVKEINERLNSGYTINPDGTFSGTVQKLTTTDYFNGAEVTDDTNGWMIFSIVSAIIAIILGAVIIIKKVSR